MHFRLGLLSSLLLTATLACFASVTPTDLRCEYRENPLGIDAHEPRLSWQLDSSERGQRQTAYRVRAASSEALLVKGLGDLWDSGRVESGQSVLVRYAGRPLSARQAVFWNVQVWDKDGRSSDPSTTATWEMGLTDASDWAEAQWIRLDGDPRNSPLSKRLYQTRDMNQPRTVESLPAPLMRREFTVKPGVQRARAYVCGLGYSEIYMNGRRCGDAVLDPGQTTYDRRALYVTHDLTKPVREGTNVIGVMLGNGFFGQDLAFGGGLGYGAPGLLQGCNRLCRW